MNPIIIGNATLYRGDCLDVLRTLTDNSIDSIVTDPPYGLTSARPGGRSQATEGKVMRGFMGLQWDSSIPSVEMWAECLRVLKPGGYLLAFAGTRTQHRMAVHIEDAGFEIRDMIAWIYGSGFPKSHNGDWGGTALKPALEPITVARKPLIGTVEANWREYGTGALNIDGCRVGDEVRLAAFTSLAPCHGNALGAAGTAQARRGTQGEAKEYVGRWPANLIHDGSEEVIAAFPQAKGQQGAVGPQHGARTSVNTYGDYGPREQFEPRGDIGSAARFFYCAKASRKDRNDGTETNGTPAVSTGATMRDKEDADWKKRNGNFHPTVKPTDLMRYLCRLVTPPGGVVLDLFIGSGSTGKAAILEGFRFIGIERDEDENGNPLGYMDIAVARIGHVQKQERNESAQMSIFGEVESCLA